MSRIEAGASMLNSRHTEKLSFRERDAGGTKSHPADHGVGSKSANLDYFADFAAGIG